MTWYVFPSLLALTAKLLLAWIARSNLANRPVFAVLLVSLFVTNAVEFTSYFIPDEAVDRYVWLMQLYYIGALVAAASAADICLSVTGLADLIWRKINALLAVTVGLLTLVPGTVIAGVEPMGEFVHRVPGPALSIWTTYVVLAVSVSIGLLLRGIVKAPTRQQRRQSCALAMAFAPALLSAGLIVIFMSLGYLVNGAVTMSLASTVLVVIVYLTESRYHLFRLLSACPATAEYRASRQLQELTSRLKSIVSVPERQSELRAIMAEIETLSYDMAIDAHDGNLSQTARSLHVSRATVVRKRSERGHLG